MAVKGLKKNKSVYSILLILLSLLLLYAYSDITNSAQAGIRGAARGSVYVLLAAIISTSILYNFFRSYTYIKTTQLSLVLMSMTVWILIVNLLNGSSLWISIIHITLSIWWIVSYWLFYNYPRKNLGSVNAILFLFFVMCGFYIWGNYYVRSQITALYDRDFAVSGYAYLLIIFVPFIGLSKRKWLTSILFGVLFILVFTSFKRGPMVILPIMFSVYYYTEAKINRSIGSFVKKMIVLSVVLCTVVGIVDVNSGGYIGTRFSSEELESGSGRTELWAMAFDNIRNRNFVELLFGSGSGSSLDLLGTGAHNEWIEFLFSFGLIGVVLYAMMCGALIKRYLVLLNQRSPYAPHAGMMTVYVLMVGLFGGFFFVHSTFYVFAFFGLIEFLNIRHRKIIYEKNRFISK